MLYTLWLALGTALLAAGQFAATASAQTPRFDFPADCTVGADRWYRAYVDLASDSTYRDYPLGVRSYENRRGTDLAHYSPSDPPFQVLAAAAGVVAGVPDGLDDGALRDDRGDSSRQWVECGNGVPIDQGGGWATQCHLWRNSVTVSRGARVEAGHVLGVIDSCGQSDAPHLHFQVERDGMPVDPFTGRRASRPAHCDAGGSLAGSLWRDPAQQGLATYEPVVIYRAGLATGRRTETARARYEDYQTEATVTGGAMVGYVVLLGATGGITVTGPNGVVFENSAQVPRAFARHLIFAGTPRPRSGWPAGTYDARFMVATPDGDYHIEATARIVLR